jgi:integrase
MSCRTTRSVAMANAALVSGDRADNPDVSLTSKFVDDIWDFSNEDGNPAVGSHNKRVYWSFKMPGGGLSTDARFRSLLTASKNFIYALRWHPIDEPAHTPSSLRNLFCALKPFITHVASYSYPVLRFKDVLPHHCEDYIQNLLSSDASRARKYKQVQVLQKVFQYRGVMKDGLLIDPLKGESAAKLAGKDPRSFGSKTEIIPEEILGPLVRASLQYVEQFAGYLLDVSDKVEAIRSRMRPDQFLYFGTRCLRRHAPAAYPLAGTRIEKGVRSLRQLNTELSHLETACFVLIAFATGMRLSELLSLREGCCQTETAPGQPDLVWLHSRVFKMQGVPDGRKAKWLGGPVCAKAVQVLERLGRKVRRRARVTYLWMPTPAVHGRYSTRSPLSQPTILRRLTLYIAMLDLRNASGRTFHIHPHMFRRTFARYVARYDTTNLLALKEHFKHLSLSMTDYYVGNDLELWMLMEEETERVSFESFDKALSADQLAGPGGVRLRKKVDQAIAEGRLEKDFRGEAGDHLRKRMILDLVEAGQRIYPCAASNFCWFHAESALCTDGDRPILKHCNPGGCSNSIITLEHKPHWEKVRHDCEDLMGRNHKPSLTRELYGTSMQ